MLQTTNVHGITHLAGIPHARARFAGESLAGFPLFYGLDTIRRGIEFSSQWVRYYAGQTIIAPKDGRRDLFFVVEGRVRVLNRAASGSSVIHAELAAGEMFGELSAFGDRPRTAAVWAVERTVVAVLPPERLLATVRDNGIFALRLLNRLSAIVKDCGTEIVRLS